MAKGSKKKSGAGSLGQALVNRSNRSHERAKDPQGDATWQGEGAQRPLVSVVDQSDLEVLLQNAELAGREFAAQRGDVQLILGGAGDDAPEDAFHGAAQEEGDILLRRQVEEQAQRQHLTVPRRPSWHAGTTPQELDARERATFLEWRRGLAQLEQNELLRLTPFEKNLDIWRQLWRVVERSHVVVSVVDSRNPLFYQCPDLEAYVREVDPHKTTVLLLNKADLLPRDVRLKWADYFKRQGTDFIFWSAKAASEEEEESPGAPGAPQADPAHIFSRGELLGFLQTKAEAVRQAAGTPEEGAEEKPVVAGFVGYPNVGKSSTINALVGAKKTGVTATPGKTKHFQTLPVLPGLTLCDCPGLVFPSFAASRSEMVVSGVLPIDRITDERGPVGVVCRRVARAELEKVYGIVLPHPAAHERQDRPPTGTELLRVFALARGQVGVGGLPQETRAARHILKDFLSGKLQHYVLPPEERGEEGARERPDTIITPEARSEAALGLPSAALRTGRAFAVQSKPQGEGHGGSAPASEAPALVASRPKDGEGEGGGGPEGSAGVEGDGEEGSDGEDSDAGGHGGGEEEGSEGGSEGEEERSDEAGLDDDDEDEGETDGTGGGEGGKQGVGEQDGGKALTQTRPRVEPSLDLGLPTGLRVKTSPGASSEAALDALELISLDGGVKPAGARVGGGRVQGSQRVRAAHKMHQKASRKKDRSWRVNKDGQGPYKI